jgi:SnoaL-like polyketide cyclase
MADKDKKPKQVLLRKRVPQIVTEYRRRRGRRRQGQRKGSNRHLNAVHGQTTEDIEEAPQVRELVLARQPAEPTFHGVPRHYLGALSDINFTINGQCQEEARIVSRWSIRAVHSGELLGVPPTGREVTITGATLVAVEGERIEFPDGFTSETGRTVGEQWGFWVVEEWNYWDVLGLLAQIREGQQALESRV